MAQTITMPALSPTMTEGKLARWVKSEGDSVEIGDVIAEIETDKATMEVEAVEEGTLGRIVVAGGTDNVAVNDVIGVLLEEGDSEDAIDTVLAGAKGGGESAGGDEAEARAPAPAETASSGPAPADATAPANKPVPESPGGSATTPSVAETGPAPPAPTDQQGQRILASPLARRLAKHYGLNLAQIQGSGPNGRIVRADVEAAKERAPAEAAAPASEKAPASGKAPAAPEPTPAKAIADGLGMTYDEVPVSGMRKTIAQRLQESKQTIPHFYLTVDCHLDQLLAVRKQLNDRADGAYKLSVNDFIVRACALALRDVPQANTAFNGDTMLRFHHADVAVAVAIDEGLITPIVKAAETKGLKDISGEVKDLASRAKDGKLKPHEYQGGTFTVSNLGMYGIREFSAIINPPQACILAVGAGEKRPYVRDDGSLDTATMMTCTLSCDHRVVDGAVGAQFLAAFRAYIQDPMTMLL